MRITVDIDDQLQKGLESQANVRGVGIEEYARKILERAVIDPRVRPPLSIQERREIFAHFADGLPQEAVDESQTFPRSFIYQDDD